MKCVTDTAAAIKFLESEIETLEYYTAGSAGDAALEEISIVSSDHLARRAYLYGRLEQARTALAELQPVQPNV